MQFVPSKYVWQTEFRPCFTIPVCIIIMPTSVNKVAEQECIESYCYTKYTRRSTYSHVGSPSFSSHQHTRSPSLTLCKTDLQALFNTLNIYAVHRWNDRWVCWYIKLVHWCCQYMYTFFFVIVCDKWAICMNTIIDYREEGIICGIGR